MRPSAGCTKRSDEWSLLQSEDVGQLLFVFLSNKRRRVVLRATFVYTFVPHDLSPSAVSLRQYHYVVLTATVSILWREMAVCSFTKNFIWCIRTSYSNQRWINTHSCYYYLHTVHYSKFFLSIFLLTIITFFVYFTLLLLQFLSLFLCLFLFVPSIFVTFLAFLPSSVCCFFSGGWYTFLVLVFWSWNLINTLNYRE